MVKITVDRIKSPSFTVFAINKRTILTVKVPEKMYKDISILTTSADISAENLTSEDVKLVATSGDIQAENVKGSSSLQFKTTSGDIQSIHNEGKNIGLLAKSGDVLLEMDQPSYQIDFYGTSGEGEVHVPGFQFEEKSESRIKGRIGSNNGPTITVKTKSGDFTLK
jgi:lia operon protein LiaG